jgi:hypothetical protein
MWYSKNSRFRQGQDRGETKKVTGGDKGAGSPGRIQHASYL